MPPKRRNYGRKKDPKPPGPPVFGPAPPPPPDSPPASASASAHPAGAQPAAQDDSAKPRHRRKKLPRKKIAKDSQGGWHDDLDEREPHPDDEGRYDSDVPYDLRLLRCCDEFRSLRSLGHPDRRVNYQAALRYFQINVPVLRAKFGSQPLRGYDPEPEDADSDDGDDDDGDGVENELLETKIEEIVERSEHDWAKVVLALPRLAKFFDNRYNDAYTPTLSLAPQIMKSFLRFMTTRKVIPGYDADIEACVAVCDVAAKQLYPAQRVFKEVLNASQLGPAVQRLFPSPDSTLSSPIVVVPDFISQPANTLPDLFSNISLAAPDSDLDVDADDDAPSSSPAAAAAGPVRSWPDAHPAPRDAPPTSAEDTTRARLERIRAQFEREAEAQRAWEDAERALRPKSSTAVLQSVLGAAQVIGGGKGARGRCEEDEKEGMWRVGYRERCARELHEWELLAPAPASASDGRRLVRLHLGPHERTFALDATHDAPPLSTREAVAALGGPDADALEAHSGDSPLSLVVDLGTSFNTSHLDALASPPAILECDLAQLVFVPSSSAPPSTSSPRAAELWTLAALHRLIPAYWRHGGELLRGEPGRQLSFPGEGYELGPVEEKDEEKDDETSREG